MSLTDKKTKRGYMYIGHIPHGFYEKEMKEYFSQFGKLRRLRLARSKATGRYKGYGFLEFENEGVAKIAADTMDNYLMFNKILKCQLIPKEKLHPRAFRNSHKLFNVPIKSLFRRKYNKAKSQTQIKEAKVKLDKKLKKKQNDLKKMGIDIDLTELAEGKKLKAKAVEPPKKEQVVATESPQKPVKQQTSKKAVVVEAKPKKQDQKPKQADLKKNVKAIVVENSKKSKNKNKNKA